MKRLSFYLTNGSVIKTADEYTIAFYYSCVGSDCFTRIPMFAIKDENGNACTINTRHIIRTEEKEV